jgi:hypothetical protein
LGSAVANHPITLKLFYSGVYNDVSTDVSQVDAVTVRHGGSEVSDAPRPSTVDFTFEDPTGKYRPYLPTSALYGLAGRNTPLQITDGGSFEVASWAPDQTVGFSASPLRGRRWTEVQAAGPLRRVGGWTEPIASAITRKMLTLGLTEFWSLEDDRDATGLANPYGTAGQFETSGLGASESPGGGSTSFKMSTGNDSEVFGRFGTSTSASSWQVAFAFKLNQVPTAAGYQQLMAISVGPTGVTQFWQVSVNQDSYRLQIFDSTGSAIVDQITSYSSLNIYPNQWAMCRLQATLVAGTLTWGIGWISQTESATGVAGSVAATLDRPYSWSASCFNSGGYLEDANVAYVAACNTITPDLIGTAVFSAFGGYNGETTGARFLRLCGEEGVTAAVEGTSDELMGPQRPDTFLKLLQEIRDTDGGYLVDDRNQLGLYLRSRKSIYAQAVDIALTYGTNVGPPLKPILDDLNTHNLITVSNRGGGTAVVEDTTSAMGSAAPPTGVGKAKQDIAVNLRNASRLTDVAYWWLHMGTLPDVRYSSVTVDLDANSSLETAAVALRPGDRITIASLDPDLIDLLVIGTLDKRDNQKRRTVTFTCVPYRQYDVALYIATGTPLASTQKRYDSRTSTTNTTLNTTVGTVVVKFTDLRDAWSTTGVPYDWAVAGERIRVTAMGAVTGAGPYTQSATVTRSINGVVKTHAAGEPVHMHPDQQARYAL